MCATLLQPCPTLCDSMDCSPPGSSVHGILQARILEWVACPPPGDPPDPRIEPVSLMTPALADRFFTTSATGEAIYKEREYLCLAEMLMSGRNQHNSVKQLSFN